MLSFLSLQLGDSSSVTNDSAAGHTQPSSQSTVLNFLAALGSIDAKKIYHPFELGLNDSKETPPVAGFGGHAVVRIGRLREDSVGPDGRLIAVKGLRRTAQQTGLETNKKTLYDKHFTQLTLEIRILGHVRLSKHPNIVKLLGICMDDKFQIASLGLVLEYSDLGSMKNFLFKQSQGRCSLTTGARVDLARQVAEALKFLHDYRICHGDVKLENVLVFRGEDETFVAKLSDFGQSVVAMSNTETFEPIHGTPLLEAPELRRGKSVAGAGITNALQADIFSFGLLFWEALKCGRPYFDSDWLDASPDIVGEMDIEDKERFLDSLPQNKLLDYGEQFLLTLDEDILYRQRAFEVFNGCLQDDPSKRKTMSAIVKSMNAQLLPEIEDSNEDQNGWNDLSDRFRHLFWGDTVVSWSGETYLSSLIESAFGKGVELHKFPWALQQHILAELQLLASDSAAYRGARAAAAMAVSECYTLGIGTDFNRRECLRWLATAALEGNRKAELWYHRIRESFGVNPELEFSVASDTQFEDELSQIPTELYLTMRLQKYNACRLESIRSSFGKDGVGGPWTYSLNFFEPTNDYPLHVAALYGDDTFITSTITCQGNEATGILELSVDGYSAVHFACIGGHLSTLKLLLAHGGNAAGLSDEDITPLHLAIFFPQNNTHAAVDILMKYGANANAASSFVLWDDLDIPLFGSPLLWAVGLRNRILVHALIQYSDHTNKTRALQLALALYFWEIAEDLLNYFEAHGGVDFEMVPLQSTKQPFRHWITHGKDLSMAMHRTVQVCYDHGLLTKPGVQWGLERNLRLILETMRSEADFHLVEALWRTWCSHSPDSQKTPILTSAFRRSGHNGAWRPTLEMLVDGYSVAELNATVFPEEGFNMLHAAVNLDAVVAARILLERGVNVNQPTSGLQRTALHLCAYFDISNEMWELLLEFNAALDARDLGGSTPFETAFMGMRPTLDVEKCTTMLQHVPSDDAYVELLHTLLINLVINDNSRFSLDDLRVVLTQGRSQACVNLPSKDGITLLQEATFLLRPAAVKLLLEAGADANVGFREGIGADNIEHMILPLQLALIRGVVGKPVHGSRSEPGVKEKAYEIAQELLSWHQANEDLALATITPLHVACLLQLSVEVDRLTANTSKTAPRSEPAAVNVFDTPIPWLSQENGVVTAAALMSCKKPADRIAYSLFGHQNLSEKHALFGKFTDKLRISILSRSPNLSRQVTDIQAQDAKQREEEEKINTDGKLGCDGNSSPPPIKTARKERRWRRWLGSLLSNHARKADNVPGPKTANREPESHTTSSTIGEDGGQPPLVIAARDHEEFVTKRLLDHGADVNSKAIGFHDGRTALSFAVQGQNESMVKLLLDYGADVNCSATGGIHNTWTPLSFAVNDGHTDFVKLLLHYGAEADSVITNEHSSLTMLSLAAERGHEAIVKLLLSRGADVDSKATGIRCDRTPLSLAAEGGHEGVVKVLLDQGACIDSKAGGTDGGRTPLSYAATAGHTAVVELLLDRGADINSKVTEPCFEGMTPLVFAADGGHEATVKLLLERGADTDCKATGIGDGQTAIYCAAGRGHESIVVMLLAHGANADCKATSKHWTPLNIARIEGYTSIVQLLLDHKTNTNLKSRDPCTGLQSSHTAVEVTKSR